MVLAISLLALSHGTPAEAKQFKKLLQVGQTIPGSNQPVTEMIQPTIGEGGLVAVVLRTKSVMNAPGAPNPSTQTFQGVYAIPKNGAISLLQGDKTISSIAGTTYNEFSAPSISQGKVAYFFINQPGVRNNPVTTRNTQLRVGTPGNVNTIESRGFVSVAATSGQPNLAFVNGNAYYLEKVFGGPNPVELFGVINGKPQTLLTGTDPVLEGKPLGLESGAKISASAGLVLFTRTFGLPNAGDTTEIFERSNTGGSFKKIKTFTGRSCGISASQENVVSCLDRTRRQPALFTLEVRFGRQGAFQNIAVPSNSVLRRIFNPTINDKNVAFQTTDQVSNQNTTPVETIYRSQNAQAPEKVVATGDRLDGKTVKSVQLSETGRSLSGKAIVFTATSTDGVTALYRVDL
jgi:hypothetical protein